MADSTNLIGLFVDNFCHAYKEDPRLARCQLVAAFSACMARMLPQEREDALSATNTIMSDIGSEIFEDSTDLISFLQEKKR